MCTNIEQTSERKKWWYPFFSWGIDVILQNCWLLFRKILPTRYQVLSGSVRPKNAGCEHKGRRFFLHPSMEADGMWSGRGRPMSWSLQTKSVVGLSRGLTGGFDEEGYSYIEEVSGSADGCGASEQGQGTPTSWLQGAHVRTRLFVSTL